ncbi:phosphoglycerate mutase family protein [uncultured Umboniibacter sp.]|uniref:SixA phosphatase family protein n=1 Tax=uncultured Umboniibacter sp. TaxID=1798917 RepID=UPI0026104089|nr:phosphoglycerate mutase family protein [uncultured Umboniibacter sp.]
MDLFHVFVQGLFRKLSLKLSLSRVALAAMSLSMMVPADVAADIYLVRHAEKLEGEDPGLTDCGRQRAQWLALYFSSVPITAVFTTPYLRTRETAAPVAQDHHLTLQEYNPRDLASFSRALATYEGDVLVVGHSNTTPQLFRLITSGKVEDLDESQYDRLYRIDDDGDWQLELQSFECIVN